MHIILGATGHVGSALAKTLLKKAEHVTIVSHDEMKAQDWLQAGAEAAIVDVHDTEALREVFNRGDRLFLLNPPAMPSVDTVKEERETLASILKALEGSSITKVVGESTMGARAGKAEGDLNVLFEMEQGLKKLGLAHSIIRAAYYMSNWDHSLESAMNDGVVSTLYPVDFKLPMVAPDDLGKFAAQLMTESIDSARMIYVEGPQMYSANDVAKAFSDALGKPVRAVSTPRDQWESSLMEVGFCKEAAASMAAMTEITLNEDYERPANPERGSITLSAYISDLVSTAAATKSLRPKITSLQETV